MPLTGLASRLYGNILYIEVLLRSKESIVAQAIDPIQRLPVMKGTTLRSIQWLNISGTVAFGQYIRSLSVL